jgi:hypothetical protein
VCVAFLFIDLFEILCLIAETTVFIFILLLSGYDFATDTFSMSAPPAATTAASPSTVAGSSEWHRKLSLRYQRIREIYNNHSSDLPGKSKPVFLCVVVSIVEHLLAP